MGGRRQGIPNILFQEDINEEKLKHEEVVLPIEESKLESESVRDEVAVKEIPPEIDDITSEGETTVVTIKKKKKKKKKKIIEIEEPEEYDEVFEEDSHEVEPISDEEKEEIDGSDIEKEIKKLNKKIEKVSELFPTATATGALSMAKKEFAKNNLEKAMSLISEAQFLLSEMAIPHISMQLNRVEDFK